MSSSSSVNTDTTADAEEEGLFMLDEAQCSQLRCICGAASGCCPNANVKRVSFGEDIVVYHFPVVLGDNVACSDGPPLTLSGFKHIISDKRNFELFEYCRSELRRHGDDIKINAEKRAAMLRDRGFTAEEIGKAAEDIQAWQAEVAEHRNHLDSHWSKRMLVHKIKASLKLKAVRKAVKVIIRPTDLKTRGDPQIVFARSA